MFNKLTGLKLEISFTSGFLVSNGKTVATFAFSGNTEFSILEFMAAVRIGDKKLDAVLMSLGGIVSIPTVFLASISFRSSFTLSNVVGLKGKITCFLLLSGVTLLLICLMLGLSLYRFTIC